MINKKMQKKGFEFFLILFIHIFFFSRSYAQDLSQRCKEDPQKPECDFYKGVDNQKIKALQSYIGGLFWDRKKARAASLSMLPPLNAQTINSGIETDSANTYIQNNEFKPREDLFSWNMDILQTGVQAQSTDLIIRHQNEYCSQLEYDNGLCLSKVENPNLNDLSAQSLLGSNVISTDGLGRPYNAAFYYLRNLTNPVPIPVLSKDKMYINYDQKILSEEGRENLLAKYKQEVMLSLAQTGLLQMLLDRIPVVQNSHGEKQSKLELLQHESMRRFLNQDDWHKKMNAASTPALLREIANMMAFNMVMQYRDSQRLERIESLLDAQLSSLAQMSATAENSKQHLRDLEQNGT